jgi:KUP system potassium uptake protein
MSGDARPAAAIASTATAINPDPMLPEAAASGPVPVDVPASGGEVSTTRNALAGLALGALGVVYGDIGTSPLYTMRETFTHGAGLDRSEPAVFGVLSLVFWALILTVSVKYVILILRADNRGEGGVLSLATLVSHALAGKSERARAAVMIPAIIGLALFYGDGLITPAISVLSAVEGLNTVEPALKPWIVPLAVLVLTALFLLQARGTGRVGRLFGPVMCVWFLVLALLGIAQIVQNPRVLLALNPLYAIGIVDQLGWRTFIALGTIVLAVTGGEALYADMGHFGRRPIKIAWFGLVLPALVLNYFGQGALLLRNPESADHLFYDLSPGWALPAMVALSTMATIIASQAVISGVFSLTQQAIQLGFLPRMTIRHTSETERGQIYIPRMNWLLMTGVIALVVGFGSSSDLAGAYGIAVTGAMTVDVVLAGIVAIMIWRWNTAIAIAVFGLLALVDIAFLIATSLKIPEGGWFPLAIAAVAIYMITTWRRGRGILYERMHRDALPLEEFLERMERPPMRVAGTAVFMTGDITVAPMALLHNLKHNKVLHERIILMQVLTQDVPRVREDRRIEVDRLGKGFFTLIARYGYMEQPDVPAALRAARVHGLAYDEMQTSFFLGRETLVPSSRSKLGRMRQTLFMGMTATAVATKVFFRIPPNRAIELGGQIEV